MENFPRRSTRTKAVTLQDIASHCHVSKVTVSLALRSDPRISPATAARVIAAASELGYSPVQQIAARRLALRKQGRDVVNNLIALCFPGCFYQVNYFLAMFQGILSSLAQERYGLLTLDLFGDGAGGAIEKLPPIFERGELDGAIFFTSSDIVTEVLAYIRNNIGFGERPVVALINPLESCSSVTADMSGGAYASAVHLLDLGHRDLLHLTFPADSEATSPFKERIQAVRQAMHDRGVDPARHLHTFPVSLDWVTPRKKIWEDDGVSRCCSAKHDTAQRLRQFLRERPEITAILGINDPTALHVWECLQAAGWQVPEEMSIIGFDDTDPMPGEHGRNLLTSVHLPLVQIGREAAKLLVHRINGELQQDEIISLPASLIIRGSTAPAPPRDRPTAR